MNTASRAKILLIEDESKTAHAVGLAIAHEEKHFGFCSCVACPFTSGPRFLPHRLTQTTI